MKVQILYIFQQLGVKDNYSAGRVCIHKEGEWAKLIKND
jgi:hypothetical protein